MQSKNKMINARNAYEMSLSYINTEERERNYGEAQGLAICQFHYTILSGEASPRNDQPSSFEIVIDSFFWNTVR